MQMFAGKQYSQAVKHYAVETFMGLKQYGFCEYSTFFSLHAPLCTPGP